MTKSKNILKTIIVLVAIVAVAIGGYFIFVGADKNAKSVMECNVNPSVQFILNSSDKVVGVNVLNQDGETLVAGTNFEGLSAEEAARLFVKLSTEAGYIDVDTTGTRVDITVYGETSADYEELKSKITNKVNAYFDENGIIAGAVTTVSEDLEQVLGDLGVRAQEYADATKAEMLALIQTTAEKYEDTSITLRNGLISTIDSLKNLYSATMDLLESQIENTQTLVNNLTGELKKAAQEDLDNLKKQFNDKKAQLDAEINDAIENIKTQSVALFDQAEDTIQALIQDGKQALNAHKTAFEQNKEAIQNSINEWRATLQ